MHVDIADIQFFSKSAVIPKYCLLTVDLFTSEMYTYPMKSRHLLAQKMELFYQGIQPKRQQVVKNERMRLQTNLEFQQNGIKRLNKKYNVEMFSLRMLGEKLMLQNRKLESLKKAFDQKQKSTQGNFHQY